MLFKLNWTTSADLTFSEEIDFIFLKWNESEVIKFIKVVDDCLCKLQSYPNLGRLIEKKNIYRLTISRQTTLYYKILHESQQIDLILFYNNLQDPKSLQKYF